MESHPLASGGGFIKAGIGGDIAATHLWAGAAMAPSEDYTWSAKASRAFGPVAFSLAGQIDPEKDEYGFSAGISYLFPARR